MTAPSQTYLTKSPFQLGTRGPILAEDFKIINRHIAFMTYKLGWVNTGYLAASSAKDFKGYTFPTSGTAYKEVARFSIYVTSEQALGTPKWAISIVGFAGSPRVRLTDGLGSNVVKTPAGAGWTSFTDIPALLTPGWRDFTVEVGFSSGATSGVYLAGLTIQTDF